MASATSTYIAANTLWCAKEGDSALSAPKELMWVDSLGDAHTPRRAYLEGKVVWDVWATLLSVSDFSVPATKVTSLASYAGIQSYGTDAEGGKNTMAYTISPSSVDANTTSQARTFFVTVTQTATGKSLTVTATQAANAVSSIVYGTPSVTSVSASSVAASGGTSTLTVGWSQTKTTYYTNGSSASETVTGYSTATVTAGSGLSGTAISSGKVSIPSAGTTTYTGSRTAYTITAYSFKANGITRSISGSSITVSQSQNSVSYAYSTPSLSLTYGTVSAAGATASFTLTYSQTRTNSYTSGVNPTTTPLSGTIAKTATSGVYVSSVTVANLISGGSVVTTTGLSTTGNVTAASLGYTSKSAARVCTVSLSVVVNGKTATISKDVNQAANVVTVTYGTPSVTSVTVSTISAAGGTVVPSVAWSQNKNTVSTAIPSGKNETVYGNSTPTAIGGSAGAGGGYISSSYKVTAPSRGTTAGDAWTAFITTSVTFSANGKSTTASVNKAVTQSANVRTTTSTTYTLTATPSTTSPTAAIQKISIAVVSTRVEYYSYTSGSTNNSGTLNTTCTVKTSKGTLSASSVTGSSTITLTTLGNMSTTSTSTYTLTFSNGTTKTVTITQQKDAIYQTSVYSRTAQTPTATTAKADGTDAVVTMYATVVRRSYFYSGNHSDATSTEAVSISLMAYSGGTLTSATCPAADLGTTIKAATTIYTITSIEGTVAGGKVQWSGSLAVKQEANSRTVLSYGTWSVTATPSATSIANTGGTFTVRVTATRVIYYTWTSGDRSEGTDYGSGSVSGSNCSVAPTTFSGGSVTVTATVAENPNNSARTCSVTVTSNSISKTASCTQAASVFELTPTLPMVGYAAGNYILQIVSRRNGKAFAPSVSLSGIVGAYIVSTTLATDVSTIGLYYCTIYFPANSSTSTRTLTATITQTGGSTKTATMTQAAKPVATKKAFFDGSFTFGALLDGSIRYAQINVSGTWSAVGDDYGGGTLYGATAVVSTTNTGSGTVISTKELGDIVVADEGTTSFGTKLLTGSEAAKYVLLYWDGELQSSFLIMTPFT